MVLKIIDYDYSKFKNDKTVEDNFKNDIKISGVFLILENYTCKYVGCSENIVYNRFYVDGDKLKLQQLLSKGNKIKIISFDKDENVDINSIRGLLKCEHGLNK